MIATKEIVWIQRVLYETSLNQGATTMVYTDSTAALDRASSENPLSTRAKQIDVRVHFVGDPLHRGSVEVCHVNSEENVADI